MRGALFIFLLCMLGFASHCSGRASVPETAARGVSHDRAFWHAIVANGYAAPPGESAVSLARELSALFASPDPELRDKLAYDILSDWIVEHRILRTSELREFLRTWSANLEYGIGESGTDTVANRSFSALGLALIANRDRQEPFLDAEEYRGLLESALAYLNAERDVRGYVPGKGWLHATAHTSDLVAELAANTRLPQAAQARILGALELRLTRTPAVYTFGEQGRLAEAAVTLARRSDFDGPAFNAFVRRLRDTERRANEKSAPSIADLAPAENIDIFLLALFAGLSAENLAARSTVLDALKNR